MDQFTLVHKTDYPVFLGDFGILLRATVRVSMEPASIMEYLWGPLNAGCDLCCSARFQHIPSLKLTANIAPANRPFAPKGKDHLPTIHFQGRTCWLRFREGIFLWR